MVKVFGRFTQTWIIWVYATLVEKMSPSGWPTGEHVGQCID